MLSTNMKDHIELSDLFGEMSLEDRMLALARRLVSYRKRIGMTQIQLSDRSGVPYGTVKLFERTGRISLEGLWMISIALGCDDQMDVLFTAPMVTAADIRNGSS